MKLRYVFSEMPYAFALSAECMETHCSFCAAVSVDTNVQCDRDCRLVIYCSESCRQNDRSFHKFECSASRQGKARPGTDTADLGVRMMSRMLTRYQLDKGVVNLSSDFPSHICKDRSFDDLMTHDWDLRRSWCHEASFQELKSAFYDYFKNTSLASTPQSLVRKFFYRLCINGFSLTVRAKGQPDGGDELGEVIYLNCSKFNHSCRPSCLYKFDGARLVVQYIDYKNDADDQPLQLTKYEFDNLTLQYGYGSFWNYGTTCPSTKQRVQSLQNRYFFKCQCVLCSDRILNEIQLNAAPIECSRCKSPFVWRRTPLIRSLKLKKTCQCRYEKRQEIEVAKMASVMFGKNASSSVKLLKQEWKKAMGQATKAKHKSEIVENFKSVIPLAKKFWHPVYNLRVGQLNEKIFTALCQWTIGEGRWIFFGDHIDLDQAISYGEAMLNVYFRYVEPYMVNVPGYALDLAQFYKLRNGEKDADRSAALYKYAIDFWKQRGEIDCCETIDKQSKSPPPLWSPKSVRAFSESQ